MKFNLSAAIVGLALVAAPAAASAQSWTPGAEITGQSVQVQTNGVVNTVYFDQGGVARITTPSGAEIPGRWTAANQQLCLQTGAGASECWPYRTAFQQGQPMSMTSSCNVTSQWVANGINQAPTQMRAGERG